MDENEFYKAALKSEKGASFTPRSAIVEYLDKENEISVSLLFPYSIWDESQSLSLSVDGYEELDLQKKD